MVKPYNTFSFFITFNSFSTKKHVSFFFPFTKVFKLFLISTYLFYIKKKGCNVLFFQECIFIFSTVTLMCPQNLCSPPLYVFHFSLFCITHFLKLLNSTTPLMTWHNKKLNFYEKSYKKRYMLHLILRNTKKWMLISLQTVYVTQ